MVGGVVRLDRQEGARPDVKGDRVGRDAPGADGFQQFRREMQARRGGGDRAIVQGIDGLVVGQVLVVLGPLGRDIGRQGHDPDIADGIIQHRAGQGELQRHQAVVALGLDGGIDGGQVAGPVVMGAKAHAVPDLQPLAGLHEGGPDIGRVAVVQGGLDLDRQYFALGADALADAAHAGGNDAGVVEDQGIAGTQEVRQVAHHAVLQRAVPDDQEAGAVTRIGGTQGNAVLGQVEIEVGGFHVAGEHLTGDGVKRAWSSPQASSSLRERE